MVWLVFGLPALVVVAGISTLVIAIKHRDGGEVTDQVQRTAQIQQTDLGPDARAGAMGLRVLLRERDGRIEVLPVAGNFGSKGLTNTTGPNNDNILDIKTPLPGHTENLAN